uniref:Uncharacterized protein n=1 Tax=Anguilla anguilla TaxID=7936 RepID=A0A0E9R223_ANGAN
MGMLFLRVTINIYPPRLLGLQTQGMPFLRDTTSNYIPLLKELQTQSVHLALTR